jgi:hypothetical protein
MAATARAMDFTNVDKREDDGDPGFIRLSDVTPQKIQWLWHGRIPMGKITIIDGDPDNGKSSITVDWAARVSRGMPFPGETQKRQARCVVMMCGEDDLSDTLVPRLDAAGADRARIVTLALAKDIEGMPLPLSFPDDLNRIRDAVIKTKAALVVIDPFMAFLSTRIQSHNDASVRQATTPLAHLMGELRCAAVLVRHLNKNSGETNALYRGGGTVGLGGAARSVLMVAPHPSGDPQEKVLARVKNNLTAQRSAIGYRLEVSPTDPDHPVVKWLSEVDVDTNALLGKRDARKEAPLRDECETVIHELLKDGPMPAKEITGLLRERDFTNSTIRNAAEKIGVEKHAIYKDGKVEHWEWRLPDIEELGD